MLLNNITELLEQMAIEGRRYFTPLYLSKRLNKKISEKDLTKLLLSPFCQDILISNFEVECPEGDTDFIEHDISLIPTEMRVCHLCGIDYIPDPKRIWVSFDFRDDYLQKIKKKNLQPESPLNQDIKKCELITV